MKKPAPLRMSPPESSEGQGPVPKITGAAPVRKAGLIEKEIIIEAEPIYESEIYFGGEPLYPRREDMPQEGGMDGFPPLPMLGIAVLVLIILAL